MTREQEQQQADNMIGAAQILEKVARELRDGAKHLRAHGLHASIEPDLWRMHMASAIDGAASRAKEEVKR